MRQAYWVRCKMCSCIFLQSDDAKCFRAFFLVPPPGWCLNSFARSIEMAGGCSSEEQEEEIYVCFFEE
jgi:hypothetical protein